MPTEDSRRLRAVYAAALQRDPEERDEYLRQACADDPALRARVAALLRAHSQDFLEGDPTSAPVRPTDERPEAVEGKVVGPYILRRELGRGGMGVVYLADDTRLSRRVALKALAPGVGRDAAGRERLRLEARAAAALSHPGIATVYALEEIGDELYLACEYVPGEPLRALLASGPLPVHHVVTIGAQVARALAAAHTLGVVHRDIKPENVVKTPSGAVKILDFGLARVEGAYSRLTQTGVVMGTPAYMAPEQALGHHVDFRTDLFAFGLMIYELASGSNPFAANTVTATLARIVEVEPPPLPIADGDGLSMALDRIVGRCLRKNPAERYGSTQELVDDFERLEAELSELRRHPSDREIKDRLSVARSTAGTSAQWWWNLHQVIVSMIYILTIYPAWYVQRWLGRPWGTLFLLSVLGAAAVGASLRLHLRFLARHSPAELPPQLSRIRRWMRAADVVFAGSQAVGALAIGDGHPEFAMLFVTIGAAILVATFVIEPATERMAFGRTDASSNRGTS